MLHYKQIQYEFCSKECIFSPGNNKMQYMTNRRLLYIYYNDKILRPDESIDYNHSLSNLK